MTARNLYAELDDATRQVAALTREDEEGAQAQSRWRTSARGREVRRLIAYWQGRVNELQREIGGAA
jgi:hypothetical protein